jgi:hypothetical protein
VKIFVCAESLCEQLGAAHGSISIQNQAAVGFIVKKRLRDAEHDKRIKSATNDCQDQRGQDCSAGFKGECFHGSNEMERRDDDIDELDADERNDDAAETVDEQIAL